MSFARLSAVSSLNSVVAYNHKQINDSSVILGMAAMLITPRIVSLFIL